MNYLAIYNTLINRAKVRPKNSTDYYEIHHIIPKSMGGDNSRNNLCNLTLKEHFFAHLLLTKIYPNNIKVHAAIWNMCNVLTVNKIKRYAPSSRTYQNIRSDYMKIKKGENHYWFGKKHSKEHILHANTGRSKKAYQYTLNGVFIKEWNSIKEVTIYCKINSSNITACCKQYPNYLSAGGFRWSYKKYNNLPEDKRLRKVKSSVINKLLITL